MNQKIEQAGRTIILVGNPNVGKSVIFSKLTGKYVTVSNYPGTTVEITSGQADIHGVEYTVLDSPGVNELAARTEDARVTCDVLRDHPDATIVQVADAKNLRRALLLTLQLAELRRPMVLVLNLMDELDKCGGKVDVRKLSEMLGVPVVPTIATAGTGIHLLHHNIPAASAPNALLNIQHPPPATPVEGSPEFPSSEGQGVGRGYEQTTKYLERVNEMLGQTYTLTRPRRASWGQKLGWWATHPVKGMFMLAVVLYLTFWFVGLFGAGTVVDLLETGVFGRYVNPWAIRAMDAVLPFPHEHEMEISELKVEIPLTPAHGVEVWSNEREIVSTAYNSEATSVRRFVHDFFVGEFGLVTMAVSYALAIVLPIVTTFFLLFSLLEDSGYLPRLAVMVNRVFRSMGLNGKAVLPMILGLGCDTMATMTTRILETRKERLITTLLLALAVPCSAQLGVLLAMMAAISPGAAVFWMALVVGIMVAVGWLAARLVKGETSDFILELPPVRRPQLGNVWMKTFARLEWYLKEVVPLFAAGTAVLFLLDKMRLLDKIAGWGEPVVTGWLGLPKETATAFLVGFLRRDFGAVYLLDAATGPNPTLSAHQVLVAMVTITLFMPCVATLFMIAKELGKKAAAGITVFVFVFAFLAGGVVNHVGRWLGF